MFCSLRNEVYSRYLQTNNIVLKGLDSLCAVPMYTDDLAKFLCNSPYLLSDLSPDCYILLLPSGPLIGSNFTNVVY